MSEIDNSFVDVLRHIRKGALLDEASKQLAELTRAVSETGRRGQLTLKIVMCPASKAEESPLALKTDVDIKAPKPDAPTSLFYAAEDGRLVRENPRQQELEFRPVRGGEKADTDDEKEVRHG